ncbi:hypothetical protein O6H91_09G052200 [Diphasiastrum complanatum]|uniref:Uncharacterized protein n=1 Tax=Diphasiastrum complanatum TaxID=34168 RepID=A0ACC2CP78_DIPCM|nr:hypothetical protein O6H91_09G052200 [Diphasiastrum complanatum]
MRERSSSFKSPKQQQVHQHETVGSPLQRLKLSSADAADWDREQLGDVLHWIRQVIGLICGLIWGAIPLTGAIWILVFLVLSSGIIYGYYSQVLKIDEEEFGGHGNLLQEGMFASVTLFLVSNVTKIRKMLVSTITSFYASRKYVAMSICTRFVIFVSSHAS